MKKTIPVEVINKIIDQAPEIIGQANSAEPIKYLGKNYFNNFEILTPCGPKIYRLFIRTDCADIEDDEKALVLEVYNEVRPEPKYCLDSDITVCKVGLNSYFDAISLRESLNELA